MQADATRRTSFFALVEAIERYSQPTAPVGGIGPPSSEILRFRTDPSLAFPVSDVVSLEMPESDCDHLSPFYTLTASFLSLVGSGSPLPILYTQEILHDAERGHLKQAFLDLFHHRLLSLFHRAWRKYRYAYEFREGCQDAYSARLLALSGIDATSISRSAHLTPIALLRCLPFFYRKPRSASALRAMLQDFLDGIPTSVIQFTPRHVHLEDWQRSALGRQNASLGANMILGYTLSSLAAGFRIVIGPIPYETYIRFLPGELTFLQLVQLTRLFTTDKLDFDFQFRVQYETTPLFWIGQPPSDDPNIHLNKKRGSLLGRTTWLRRPSLADSSGGTRDRGPANLTVSSIVRRVSEQAGAVKSGYAGSELCSDDRQ
jgi:type VI secretion system protein ImpH